MVVWEVDEIGKLFPTPVLQHRLRSPVTFSVMMHPDSMAKGAPSVYLKKKKLSVLDDINWQKKSALSAENTVADPINCFLATNEGNVAGHNA